MSLRYKANLVINGDLLLVAPIEFIMSLHVMKTMFMLWSYIKNIPQRKSTAVQ